MPRPTKIRYVNTRDFMRGVKCKIVRVSRVSGNTTVELMEDCPVGEAYKCGTQVTLGSGELSQIPLSPQNES